MTFRTVATWVLRAGMVLALLGLTADWVGSRLEMGWIRAHIREQGQVTRLFRSLIDECVSADRLVEVAHDLGWTTRSHEPTRVPLPVGLDPETLSQVIAVTDFGEWAPPPGMIVFYFNTEDCLLGTGATYRRAVAGRNVAKRSLGQAPSPMERATRPSSPAGLSAP